MIYELRFTIKKAWTSWALRTNRAVWLLTPAMYCGGNLKSKINKLVGFKI